MAPGWRPSRRITAELHEQDHSIGAHIAGDIAMLEGKVNAVVRALRDHQLEVVALHHHMLGEQPRTVFLHYYGRGPAVRLAKGFRAALDQLGKGGGMKH